MALYHIHRPQDYDELIGQEYIVKTLSNQVASGKVAHAYLFSGPRGVGKTTTARILSKAVNCTERKKGESNPCNACTSCKEITAGNAIDVIEIDAASNTGVENVRTNIIENAQFKPTKSAYKIFIIDEVHMLSTSAFNALLKIMEEPPAHILFILATTELHKIPETIISRCQRFQFKRVPYQMMKEHLERVAKEEGYTIDATVIDRIILKSDGCVRDGMSLLDQLMALGSKTITSELAILVLPTANKEHVLAFLTALVRKDSDEAFTALSRMSQEQGDFVTVADDCIDLLRHSMILAVHKGHETVLVDISASIIRQLSALGTSLSGAHMVRLIDMLLKRRQEIKSAPIPSLPLELVIIEWCDAESSSFSQSLPPSPAANTSAPTTKPLPEPPAKKIAMDTPPAVVPDAKIPEPPAGTISEPVLSASADEHPESTFTKSDVEKMWTSLITAVEQHSPSLVFILKTATITGVSGGTIILSVPYAFHKDKLTDPKCRDMLQKLFTDLLKTKAELEVTVTAQPEQKAELDELASLVGGEVV